VRRLLAAALLAGPLFGLLAGVGTARAAGFDYCSTGQHSSMLLVDRTTKFDTVDQDILIRTVEAFFKRQEAGERVLIASLSGAYTDLKINFNQCRPGCPEESFLGRLVSTCRAVIARSDYLAFEANFIAALRGLLQDQEEAPASDLFRSVAESTRLVGANGYAPLRQFLFYSDLLEASSLFPGKEILRIAPTEALRHLAAARVSAQLAGADVRVIGFGRSDGPGRPALPQDTRRRVEETWTRWLKESGPSSVQIGLR